MPAFLRYATIAVALILAGWSAVAAARQRAPDRSHFSGLALVQVFATVLAAVAIGRLIGGADPVEYATFIGYLATLLLLPPAGWVLARMEPTRWGSVILAVTGAVEAVVVLRLYQLWVANA